MSKVSLWSESTWSFWNRVVWVCIFKNWQEFAYFKTDNYFSAIITIVMCDRSGNASSFIHRVSYKMHIVQQQSQKIPIGIWTFPLDSDHVALTAEKQWILSLPLATPNETTCELVPPTLERGELVSHQNMNQAFCQTFMIIITGKD